MVKKLIKYFTTLIATVILMTMIISSVFLSGVYINIQYKNLKNASDKIYEDISNVKDYENIYSAVLINKDGVKLLTSNKMGMMPFLRSVEAKEIKEKGVFVNPMGEEFLYFTNHTDIGDIIVLQQKYFSNRFIKDAFVVLAIVFIIAVLISIPIVSKIGYRFTSPILKLQRASKELAEGNYDADFEVQTGDEIESLSHSLSFMAESLKNKDSMQRKFVANVSHDFKTPLSVIRNFTEAIKDGYVEGDTLTQYSEEIIEEVDKLNNMVMTLLELSKLQEGNYTLHREYFNVKDLVEKSANSFRNVAKARNISISIKAFDCDINGDYNYLRRCINNLLDNAIKFSNEGGRVEVIVANREDKLKVSIKDYGIGMEAEEIKNIWDRYYKHRKSGGMGLGLAICKEILDMHGFTYGVSSEKDNGTEFYFNIPSQYLKK